MAQNKAEISFPQFPFPIPTILLDLIYGSGILIILIVNNKYMYTNHLTDKEKQEYLINTNKWIKKEEHRQYMLVGIVAILALIVMIFAN